MPSIWRHLCWGVRLRNGHLDKICYDGATCPILKKSLPTRSLPVGSWRKVRRGQGRGAEGWAPSFLLMSPSPGRTPPRSSNIILGLRADPTSRAESIV